MDREAGDSREYRVLAWELVDLDSCDGGSGTRFVGVGDIQACSLREKTHQVALGTHDCPVTVSTIHEDRLLGIGGLEQ